MILEDFQKLVGEWERSIEQHQNRSSYTKHIFEELVELEESGQPVEAADIGLILLMYCHRYKIDLASEMIDKHLRNCTKREWGPYDAKGIRHHIKGIGDDPSG